jgi:hypothetical protein
MHFEQAKYIGRSDSNRPIAGRWQNPLIPVDGDVFNPHLTTDSGCKTEKYVALDDRGMDRVLYAPSRRPHAR